MKITLAIIMSLAISGCATPYVVEKIKIRDDKLSCSDIESQIREAKQFEKAARDDRKVNGKNIAAAVLFWPALVGTYFNTEEAIDAAKGRKQYMQEMFMRKGCK